MKDDKKSLAEVLLPGYKFNKKIFRSAILFLMVLLVLAWGLGGFSSPLELHTYVTCPSDHGRACVNSIYQLCNPSGELYDLREQSYCDRFSDELKNIKFIEPGESIGDLHQVKVLGLFRLVMWFVLLGSFVLNHLLYNRKYKFPKKK